MGLSRNKVAVSEGAAGSPPFYGDTDTFSRVYRIVSRLNVMSKRSTVKAECFDLSCSIFSDREDHFPIRGCSSVGRAPALQAGGHGFESHHLHQSAVPTAKHRSSDILRMNKSPEDEKSEKMKRQPNTTKARE